MRLMSLITEQLTTFWADERGTAAMDNMVLIGSTLIWAMSFAYDTATAVAEVGDDVALCMKRHGKALNRDDWDYEKKLRKMATRCGRIT